MLLIITLAVLAALFSYGLIAQGGADAGRSRADLDEEQAEIIASADSHRKTPAGRRVIHHF